MKTNFPAPSLPAAHSVQPVPAAAAVISVNLQLPLPQPPSPSLLADQHEQTADKSESSQTASAFFRAPRKNANRNSAAPRSVQNRSGPLKSRSSGIAGAPTSPDGEISNQSLEPTTDELDNDFDSRRMKLGYSIQTNAAPDQHGERSGTDEGGHRERLFKSISLFSSSAQLRAGPSPAVEKAMQSLLSANSIEALAKPLRGLVRDLDALGNPSPLQSIVLRAAKTFLQREDVVPSGVSGGSLSLSNIRAALMEGGDSASRKVTAQQGTANMWLPIYLLNLDRPRTPRQRQQAIERLDMIERRISASAHRCNG